MKSTKTMQRFKIFAALFIALLAVSYGAPQIFVAGTPQLRPDLMARIQGLPSVALAYLQHPTDSSARTNQIENAQIPTEVKKEDLNYAKINEGVYAAEDPVTKERFIKIEKGTKIEKRTVTINGQQVTVYIPVK